jgi:predicted secreted hydrolase
VRSRRLLCAVAGLAVVLLLAPASLGSPSVVLPDDEAAHPGATSERWELAGHLRSSEGRAFALLAAFRRGDHPALGAGSLLTLVIADLDGARFYSDVNLIASPSSATAPRPLELAWEGSRLERLPGGAGLRLTARGVDDRSRVPLAASLNLQPGRPPALLGADGRHPFGSSANTALAHFTSRLSAEGTLVVDGATHTVSGLVWFTHLWGPFDATGKAFAGRTTWTVHLADGRDLRVEVFRGVRVGEGLPPSALWWEDGAQRSETLPAAPEVTKRWRSPRGVLYPVAWRIPFAAGELTCRARVPDGEVLYELLMFWMRWTSLSWVGSCEVEGTVGGRTVSGEALVEATGFEPAR